MKNEVRVCLILEGTYPYITGGVSSWVHQLIKGLPGLEFSIFTISPKPDQPVHYELPENVKEHKDIVLSEIQKNSSNVKNKRAFFQDLRTIHEHFHFDSIPDIESVIRKMPTGYFPYRDAVSTDTGWEMLTHANQTNNPVYPFSDFFWAWKSSHDFIFTILGTEPPEADIYHAVSTGYAGLAGAAAKMRKGRPFLLTEHGLYHKERELEIKRTPFVTGYQRDMWIRIYNNLSRITYKYADTIISLFEYNRRKQLELGADEKKTIVIPNGIDINRYSGIQRNRREGFHVGLVGRVVPIKDVKNFIIASKIICDLIPDVTFHCIGPTDEDSAYYEDCKRLVRSFKMDKKFNFTGRKDVAEYYAFLDVICLTSVREAQPLVILEAYSAGIPVVSTKVGNVPELLDYDDRFLAPPKDPGKIARGVKFIYDNRKIVEKIVAQNRDKVIRFYSREAVYKRYGDLYHDLSGVS